MSSADVLHTILPQPLRALLRRDDPPQRANFNSGTTHGRLTRAIAAAQPYQELCDVRDPELRALTNLLPSVLIADRSTNTVKNYTRSFLRWKAFATDKHLPYLPAKGPHVALYLLHLLQSSRSPAPLDAACFAIAWAHRKTGHPSPHIHPLPGQVLQAAKRLLAAPTTKKLPLSIRDIRKLISTHLSPSTNLDVLQTLCIIVLGFSGFLRWDDLSQLHADDVCFCDGYVALFLEKRKNDQFREGHWICIAQTHNNTCPVSLLRRFLRTSKSSGHVKLFRRIANFRDNLSLRCEPISYTRAREKVLTHPSTAYTAYAPVEPALQPPWGFQIVLSPTTGDGAAYKLGKDTSWNLNLQFSQFRAP
ncbi:hypothetical protein Bbelb_304060 [Branchiostoma belcheri]|nr:hypothetical protein Bbelb_304060 [Branchiostoma belcheri]